MNQIANYSQTDWTLWFTVGEEAICKSGTITSIKRPINSNNYRQINLQYSATTALLLATVTTEQNIYIFDADKNIDTKGPIPSTLPKDGSHDSGLTPYVIMDGKFIQVTAKKNVSEAVFYPYKYAGTIDTSATYELTDHAFGDNIDKIKIKAQAQDPTKKSKNYFIWIFAIIFTVFIILGILVFIFRKNIKL